jgi:hypothetical protein
MSDSKWHEIMSSAMQQSTALTCAIRANSEKYLASMAGAKVTPPRVFLEYQSALQFLQRDLYDSVKQKSYETLFAVLLLGIFDVNTNFDFFGADDKLSNTASLASWKAHISGACKILEINGPDEYRALESPGRALAEYVRGLDASRAMIQQTETMFGYDKWKWMGDEIDIVAPASESL